MNLGCLCRASKRLASFCGARALPHGRATAPVTALGVFNCEFEIRKLLSLRTTPGATRAEVRARAEAKVADIDAKIKNLKAMRSSLQKLIEGCQGSGSLKDCSILESLDKEDV